MTYLLIIQINSCFNKIMFKFFTINFIKIKIVPYLFLQDSFFIFYALSNLLKYRFVIISAIVKSLRNDFTFIT